MERYGGLERRRREETEEGGEELGTINEKRIE